uniref:Family with sequence similarity 168 member A n=1 Tax=Taeniopygia guttata TaxID=59729 RepID=A0A674H6F1_TAEGU
NPSGGSFSCSPACPIGAAGIPREGCSSGTFAIPRSPGAGSEPPVPLSPFPGQAPHARLGARDSRRQSPPNTAANTGNRCVRGLGWGSALASLPWDEAHGILQLLPNCSSPAPSSEAAVGARSPQGQSAVGAARQAGPAAPRSPPGSRPCARQAIREGAPGAGIRSRIALEPHLAQPGGIPGAAFCRPSAFADYSSRHASLNYNSRHVRRLYPSRTTPPSTPRARPGPVALCPSPACSTDYATHDPSRGAASGGARRRGAELAGSCSPRSGGCNGPAGGTAPPLPPPFPAGGCGSSGKRRRRRRRRRGRAAAPAQGPPPPEKPQSSWSSTMNPVYSPVQPGAPYGNPKNMAYTGYTAGTPYKVPPTQSNNAPPPYSPSPNPYQTAMYPIRSAYPQQNLYTQGAYYTQPVYAAQPHVIHHTTVVQPNSIPSAIYPAPVAAPRTNGVAMGMVAGTTMAMSAGTLLTTPQHTAIGAHPVSVPTYRAQGTPTYSYVPPHW